MFKLLVLFMIFNCKRKLAWGNTCVDVNDNVVPCGSVNRIYANHPLTNISQIEKYLNGLKKLYHYKGGDRYISPEAKRRREIQHLRNIIRRDSRYKSNDQHIIDRLNELGGNY